ncbi:hypothetical protein HMPREF3156_01851 [Neisseria sp. HMSC06F02]|nr:hypothetical protein HMPREF3156_01851 [Neisseria sp. HMSC06F02]
MHIICLFGAKPLGGFKPCDKMNAFIVQIAKQTDIWTIPFTFIQTEPAKAIRGQGGGEY